jgi:hypothetical protein
VLCDTLNLADHQVAELRRAHAQVVVTNDKSTFTATWPEQMAARKPFVMQQAMERYPEQPWYCLLDADFLVRKPLQPLWSFLDNHAAALCINDGFEHGVFYRQLVTPSAIVLLRPDGKKLIDCWARWYYHDQPLDSIQPLAWYWDQITLAEAWKEAGISCAVIPLEVYSDERLRPGAAIWSANVPQKNEYYELFRNEYERQRAESLSN